MSDRSFASVLIGGNIASKAAAKELAESLSDYGLRLGDGLPGLDPFTAIDAIVDACLEEQQLDLSDNEAGSLDGLHDIALKHGLSLCAYHEATSGGSAYIRLSDPEGDVLCDAVEGQPVVTRNRLQSMLDEGIGLTDEIERLDRLSGDQIPPLSASPEVIVALKLTMKGKAA